MAIQMMKRNNVMDGLHSLYNLPAKAHPESGPCNHPAPPPPREPHMHTCQDEESGRARVLAAHLTSTVSLVN